VRAGVPEEEGFDAFVQRITGEYNQSIDEYDDDHGYRDYPKSAWSRRLNEAEVAEYIQNLIWRRDEENDRAQGDDPAPPLPSDQSAS